MRVYRSSLMFYVVLLPVCLMAGMAYFYPYSKIELRRYQADLQKFADAYASHCTESGGEGPLSWSQLDLPEPVKSNLKSKRLKVVWGVGTNQIDVATIPASFVVLAYAEVPLEEGTHIAVMADGSIAQLNLETLETRVDAWNADLYEPGPQNIF